MSKKNSTDINPPLSLHFINLTRPVDATSSDSLRQIRSHAAKSIHARARHDRLLRLQRQPTTHRPSVAEDDEDDEETRKRTQLSLAVHFKIFGASKEKASYRRIIPKLGNSCTQLPDPRQVLGSGYKNPFNSFARPISETEQFLIDHYIRFVVNNGYAHCEHDDDVFFAGMQSHYVPFCLSDEGMLAATLLSACRSMIRLEQEDRDYKRMALLYKGHCIKKANAALSIEGVATSDATIAVVLSMAADDMSVGDTPGYCVHADALVKMVEIRGGMGSTGVSGFLGHLLRWSVYNTKWRTVVLEPDRSGKMLVQRLDHFS